MSDMIARECCCLQYEINAPLVPMHVGAARVPRDCGMQGTLGWPGCENPLTHSCIASSTTVAYSDRFWHHELSAKSSVGKDIEINISLDARIAALSKLTMNFP